MSVGASLVAASVNGVFGLLLAWVLARYEFPGRRIVDALVDLPFALPTAVAGIVLTTIYAPNGWLGAPLDRLGIKVAFTPLGITIALIFIGLPFVVRTLQPVIEDLDPEIEEAATSLGAGRATVLLKVVLPYLFPAWLTGFALAFARAVGEYGSVVFISGNMPMRTEIAPLLIITKLEQYRLRRCNRDCHRHAADVVPAAADDQRAPGLEQPSCDRVSGATGPTPPRSVSFPTNTPGHDGHGNRGRAYPGGASCRCDRLPSRPANAEPTGTGRAACDRGMTADGGGRSPIGKGARAQPTGSAPSEDERSAWLEPPVV